MKRDNAVRRRDTACRTHCGRGAAQLAADNRFFSPRTSIGEFLCATPGTPGDLMDHRLRRVVRSGRAEVRAGRRRRAQPVATSGERHRSGYASRARRRRLEAGGASMGQEQETHVSAVAQRPPGEPGGPGPYFASPGGAEAGPGRVRDHRPAKRSAGLVPRAGPRGVRPGQHVTRFGLFPSRPWTARTIPHGETSARRHEGGGQPNTSAHPAITRSARRDSSGAVRILDANPFHMKVL